MVGLLVSTALNVLRMPELLRWPAVLQGLTVVRRRRIERIVRWRRGPLRWLTVLLRGLTVLLRWLAIQRGLAVLLRRLAVRRGLAILLR